MEGTHGTDPVPFSGGIPRKGEALSLIRRNWKEHVAPPAQITEYAPIGWNCIALCVHCNTTLDFWIGYQSRTLEASQALISPLLPPLSRSRRHFRLENLKD
jgi:hypothetical protein